MPRSRGIAYLVASVVLVAVAGSGLGSEEARPPGKLPRIEQGELIGVYPGKYTYVERGPLPALPASVMVYQVQPRQSKKALLSQLVRALRIEMTPGIEAQLSHIARLPKSWLPEEEPLSPTIGEWDVTIYPGGHFSAGNQRLAARMDKGNLPAPSEDDARKAADAFLARIEHLLPYPVRFTGVHPAYRESRGSVDWKVLSLGVSYRAEIDGIEVGHRVSFVVGPEAEVVSLSSTLRRVVPYRRFPILSPKEAFEKVRAGEGLITDGPSWNATAYLDTVKLVYWQGNLAQDFPYLMPFYLLKGEAVAEGKKTVRWAAELEAIRPEWLEDKDPERP